MIKTGRKPKPEEERMDERLVACVTRDEKIHLQGVAARAGLDLPKWMRITLFAAGRIRTYAALSPIDLADLHRAIVLAGCDERDPVVIRIRAVLQRHELSQG